MLAISQGFRELVATIQGQQCGDGHGQAAVLRHGQSSNQDGRNGRCSIDQETDKAIQSFFNRFYTINLGTRLLIGKAKPFPSCCLLTFFRVWSRKGSCGSEVVWCGMVR